MLTIDYVASSLLLHHNPLRFLAARTRHDMLPQSKHFSRTMDNEGEGAFPHIETSASQCEAMVPHLEAVILPNETIVLHPEAVAFYGEATVPHHEAVVFYGEATIPHYEAAVLHDEATVLNYEAAIFNDVQHISHGTMRRTHAAAGKQNWLVITKE